MNRWIIMALAALADSILTKNREQNSGGKTSRPKYERSSHSDDRLALKTFPGDEYHKQAAQAASKQAHGPHLST